MKSEKIPLVKKDFSEGFDLPMGFLVEGGVSELVRTFILNKLKNVFQKNSFGLYRDVLAVSKGLSGPSHQIYIEQMSNARQTMIISFILG